nr:MAG TPA: hypothetical protein [Caudoviricetes sp.]
MMVNLLIFSYHLIIQQHRFLTRKIVPMYLIIQKLT